jgi:hypothetical protein
MPDVRFRIIVQGPLRGVTYAVQRGRDGLLEPVRATDDELVFEFPLTIADLDAIPPRLTGKFAQGPPSSRFVYVNSGSMAGEQDSCWRRRAKVRLDGIARSALEQVAGRPAAVLEARIAGKSRDGGPACATVPLLSHWSVAEDT